MDPGALLEGRSRETKIRRDARGRWWNDADPIDHTLLAQAFDAWIDRADDGRYCLKNDINWAYVTVEGAPVFVRSIEIDGERVVLRLSDGRAEDLDPATLREDRDGALHCQVRDGRLAARFDAHAAVQLDPLVGEDERGTYVRLGGARVRPPVVDDPIGWAR